MSHVYSVVGGRPEYHQKFYAFKLTPNLLLSVATIKRLPPPLCEENDKCFRHYNAQTHIFTHGLRDKPSLNQLTHARQRPELTE